MASMEFRATIKALKRSRSKAEIKSIIGRLDQQFRDSGRSPKVMKEKDWPELVRQVIKAMRRIERRDGGE